MTLFRLDRTVAEIATMLTQYLALAARKGANSGD